MSLYFRNMCLFGRDLITISVGAKHQVKCEENFGFYTVGFKSKDNCSLDEESVLLYHSLFRVRV